MDIVILQIQIKICHAVPLENHCHSKARLLHSQLWNPLKAYLITQLEELRKHFVRRIHGFQEMEYNETLHELNLLSLQ